MDTITEEQMDILYYLYNESTSKRNWVAVFNQSRYDSKTAFSAAINELVSSGFLSIDRGIMRTISLTRSGNGLLKQIYQYSKQYGEAAQG